MYREKVSFVNHSVELLKVRKVIKSIRMIFTPHGILWTAEFSFL